MERKIKVQVIDRQMFVLGYTLESLVKKTGLSRMTVIKVLYARCRPSKTTSKLLAEALKIDEADLRAAIYDTQQSTGGAA